MAAGQTCEDFIRWGDCDLHCNLCACSTASGTNREHCSGHGTCEASCSQLTCSDAKCKCDADWTGDRCEFPKGCLEVSFKLHSFSYCYYLNFNTRS